MRSKAGQDAGEPNAIWRSMAAFWALGLLNNFLWVVMNAGANQINDAGVGLVYLANILPTLLVKLTGPYWFHYVTYTARMWISAVLMVLMLFIVAWAEGSKFKLVGVSLAALQSGIGEASLLAMASFYDSQRCLAAWSSGTGFAGILGYFWSILFSQALNACFQLELMAGLWIPVAWLLSYHFLLDEPWIDRDRTAETDGEADSDGTVSLEYHSSSESTSESLVNSAKPVTSRLTTRQRFSFILTLWRYMVPLYLVYAAEYIIQSGTWASMGFPVTDKHSRHEWYRFANFTYQIGVFISRSTGGLVLFPLSVLWAGPTLQLIMMVFFYFAAATPFGNWWLILPALVVGLLGGFVYVQAYVQISKREDERYVELALSSASVADTFGIITANICAILLQGCLFGRLGVTDTKPDFTCGYHIWDVASKANTTAAAAVPAGLCFPGVTSPQD